VPVSALVAVSESITLPTPVTVAASRNMKSRISPCTSLLEVGGFTSVLQRASGT
jgi:hypothetical protein